MFLKIVLGLGAVMVVFIIIVALRPSDFRITRSTLVSAPPLAVFAQVNDFHHWDAWSPWAKMDPAMKVTYDGAMSGTGASYAWAGNRNVGEGRMTITESQAPGLIRIKLEFLKPFPGTNAVEFTFVPQGSQTLVTWTMTGHYSFIPKAVGLFLNMDKMIGGQFEQGLAQMKTIAEAAPAP